MSEEEKISQLDKVLSSRAFEKSPTSSRLLQFLVTSTISKKQLKETTVGIELFGQGFLKDPNTSRIRVNIYNLRKKLDAYYQNEGRNDPVKIIIDKGQYYTEFAKNSGVENKSTDYKKRYKIASLISVFLALGIVSLAINFLHNPAIPVWDAFFNNNKETTVYVGDFFGIMGKTATGKVGWNRDYEINSLSEFYAFKQLHPNLDSQVVPSEYTYMTGMGAIGIQHLTQLFTKFDKDFSIRFSNKSNYEDIKERNTIYIGPFKNKNKFLTLLDEKTKHIDIRDQYLTYTNSVQQQDTTFNLLIAENEGEFALVSRLRGNDGNEQFFFFSDHDIGVMATVAYFTDPKSLASFTSSYLRESDTFLALYFVKGKERTNLSLDLIFVDTDIEL